MPFTRQASLSAAVAAALSALETSCAPDEVGLGRYGTPDDAATETGPPLATTPRASMPPVDGSPMPSKDEAAPPPVADGSGEAASSGCDLNGRWLVASRSLADALGQTQASHNWFYYEIRQDSENVTVTRGLHCGYEVVHVSALGAEVDSHLVWPSLLVHQSDTGRKGSVSATPSGCQVQFAKQWNVSGATVSAYSMAGVGLPSPSQQASGTTAGWEDWDGDGHPGITLSVSGAATGRLYLAQRDWSVWSGEIAANSSTFKLSQTWAEEQDPLGYSGSSLVTQSAAVDGDPAQHYVWFARLDNTQATGDPTAICSAVRSLVSTLAPQALK
jgi:hypothetical protein